MIVIFILFLNQINQVIGIIGGYEIQPHRKALKYRRYYITDFFSFEISKGVDSIKLNIFLTREIFSKFSDEL